jgi:hypothetical protein
LIAHRAQQVLDRARAADAAADAAARAAHAAARAAQQARWQWLYVTYRHAVGPSFAFDPAWRTSDAVAIARGIFDERAFDRMPILADALQDAGMSDLKSLLHLQNDADEFTQADWWLTQLIGYDGE